MRHAGIWASLPMKPIRHSFLILLASLLVLASACTSAAGTAGPTPFPMEQFPTVVAETAQAAMATNASNTQNAPSTATSTPTETSIPPTSTSTPTATPAPSAPISQIQIYSPGPMSKVTSPIQLRMQVVSGGSQLVQIELQGEDGRLLARTLERIKSFPGGVYVTLRIPFEILTAAEVGRITVSTKDGYGRLQSLSTVHVLLLSVGPEEINPAGDLSERVVLYQPGAKDTPSGGVLYIEGRYLPFNDNPVILELQDEEGNTVGLRVLGFPGVDEQTLSTTIPYKISAPTEARLILRQDDDHMAGQVYLFSREITINP